LIEGSLYLDRDYSELLIAEVQRTSSMLERMQGLLGRPPLEDRQALLIVPCSSIHTFFMAYSLDLVFLDKHWQITKLVPALEPWRVAWSFTAAMVLEMPAHSMENMTLIPGQTLYWKENCLS